MSDVLYIGEAAGHPNVTPNHLPRMFEREGHFPPVGRDLNGRVSSKLGLALLQAKRSSQRPRRLERPGDPPGVTP